jgi:hypothetical protein
MKFIDVPINAAGVSAVVFPPEWDANHDLFIVDSYRCQIMGGALYEFGLFAGDDGAFDLSPDSEQCYFVDTVSASNMVVSTPEKPILSAGYCWFNVQAIGEVPLDIAGNLRLFGTKKTTKTDTALALTSFKVAAFVMERET